MSKNIIDQVINRARGLERTEEMIANQAYKVRTPMPGVKEAARVVSEFTNGNLTEDAKESYLRATGQEFWIGISTGGSLWVVNSEGKGNVELGKNLYNEGGAVRSPQIEETPLINRGERYG